MNRSHRARPARFGIALATVALVAPAVLTATRAVVAPGAGAIAVSAAAILLLLATTWRWTPCRLDGRGGVVSLAVWLAACGFAAYQLAEVAAFMGDVSRSDRAYYRPRRTFDDDGLNGSLIPGHYCATAYVVASQLATEHADNIYDSSLYNGARPDQRTIVHEQIGDVFPYIDDYEYPPPFLLLPKLLIELGGGVLEHRSLLFGLEVATLVVVLVAFAHWISRDHFGAAWFALPILLLVPDMLTTLQIGNVHFLIICLAMAGMLALERRRYALGGLLLGFSIVGKLFPVVLLAYLAARRSWRGLAFTVGSIALYGLLTLALFGWKPFGAFSSYQLPRLSSGEAFGGLLSLSIVKVLNVSLAGIPPKLALLGWTEGESGVLAATLSVALPVLLLLASVSAGLRHRRAFDTSAREDSSGGSRALLAATWLALLVLAQLRSPLLPTVYGNLSTVWLVCLVAASTQRVGPSWFLPMGLIFALPVTLPFGPPTPSLDLGFTVVTPLVALVFAAWIALRGTSRSGKAAAASSG